MTEMKIIEEKIHAGKRIDETEALFLFEKANLYDLGRLALSVKERLHGKDIFYNINRHINYSNVCYAECKFCEFGQIKKSPKAYEYSNDDIREKTLQAVHEGATEIHMVGGLHPELKIDYYVNLLKEMKAVAPEIHIKAFTAVEIDFFAKVSKLSIREVLSKLIEAGLGSMPGGGAEIFSDRLQKELYPNKANAKRWLEIHHIAHEMGLKSNATMLYGIGETNQEKVEHMRLLREEQDSLNGFQTFIPLSFVPFETPMQDHPEPTGLNDLRSIAVSRIYLDNFPHIKVYWVMMGLKLAQIALQFGADDFDGTLMQEKIVHMAGAGTPEGLDVGSLKKLILETGGNPVERDTLYNRVQRQVA